MRIDADTPLWLVTDAGQHSTLPDVCSRTTLRGLMQQVLGGLDASQNPTLYTDEEEAHQDASNRLLAFRAARWIREQRGLPADEVVRITLHDGDGRELWKGEVR
jgi:hypothetical protein